MEIPSRSPTDDETTVLNVLLSGAVDGAAELREQIRLVSVVGLCDCGCPTIDLAVPIDAPRSAYKGRLWPVEGRITSPSGEIAGEVLLFLHDGRLSSLECVWYEDNALSSWPVTEISTSMPHG